MKFGIVLGLFVLSMMLLSPVALASSSALNEIGIQESDVAAESSIASNHPKVPSTPSTRSIPAIPKTPAVLIKEKAHEAVTKSLPEKTTVASDKSKPRKPFSIGADWCEKADIDGDRQVNPVDSALVRNLWGQRNCSEENDWCSRGDVNRSGKVSIMDSFFVYMQRGCSY